MEFSYDLSLEEAREAYWLHYWQLRTKIAAMVFSIVLLVDAVFIALSIETDVSAGVGLLRSLSSDGMSTFLILFGILLLFFGYVFFLLPWIVLRPLRKNPELLSYRQASMTSEYFEVQAGFGSSQLKWVAYKYWREGKNVVILKVAHGPYQAISKRGFSEVKLRELREILKSVLPKK